MDKLLEKLKSNSSFNTKNVGIFLMLLVIVMIVINSTFNASVNEQEIEPIISKDNISSEISFEQKLENILESMSGVQNVSVMVAYENTIEKIPLYDSKEVTTITEESDKQGGARKTKEVNNEYQIAYEEIGNTKTALVKQNLMPKIIGVVVTYEGNQSSITKENILNAIMALTGLGANKIQVFDK